MARCPFAQWRPLPEQGTHRATEAKRLAILHTAVDSSASSLHGYFSRSDVSVESHFYVRSDGHIEQYLDTDQRADANRDANDEAVSIETDDNPGNVEIQPWTPAQRASIVRLLDWLCDTHPGITRDKAQSPTGRGIGWHSMWGAPSRWTPAAGKTCPGAARKAQMPGIIWEVAVLGLPHVPPPIDNLELTVSQYDDLKAKLDLLVLEQGRQKDLINELYQVLLGTDVPGWGDANPRHNSVVTRLGYLFHEFIGGRKEDPNSPWSIKQRIWGSFRKEDDPAPV